MKEINSYVDIDLKDYYQKWESLNQNGYFENKRFYHVTKYNITFFQSMSRDLAYFLGLWYADGCMSIDEKRGHYLIHITLNKQDEYLLKKINELTKGCSLLFNSDKNAVRIVYRGVEVCKYIWLYGGRPKKSLDCLFPYIPNEYLSDFVRGYFDGDGSIYYIRDNNVNIQFTCGSKIFLQILWNELMKRNIVQGGCYSEKVMKLSFGKKDTLSLCEWMYKNSPNLYLSRKYDKYINYINRKTTESLKNSANINTNPILD